jgi:hypothetical protein
VTQLGEPARRVVMRAGLMRFVQMIAALLEFTPTGARDLARSVLDHDNPDDAHRDAVGGM